MELGAQAALFGSRSGPSVITELSSFFFVCTVKHADARATVCHLRPARRGVARRLRVSDRPRLPLQCGGTRSRLSSWPALHS